MKLFSRWKIKCPSGKREWIVLFCGALIYAVLFACGSQIEKTGATQAGETVQRMLCALPAAFAALYLLFVCVLPACGMRREKGAENRTFRTLPAFFLLLLCYAPMFLIQFPGSYGYDIYPQANQAASGNFNTFHPLLHTLFLRVCLDTMIAAASSIEKGAALCTVIQMALVSLLFAQACASVFRSCSRRAAYIALAFFALHPCHMAFASTYTKDVLFSAFLVLMMALCLEEVRLGHLSRGRRIVQIACGVFACLLRNNMIYAMCVWLLLLFFFGRRFRLMALCAVLTVVGAVGCNHALIAATQAEKGPIREMLSIPAQQFARVRVLAPEILTQDEIQAMDGLFQQVDFSQYDPTLADAIKDRIDDEAFLRDPAGAARLWLAIGAKAPGMYLDAFLNTALPALYPYSQYKVSSRYMEIGKCNDGLTRFYGVEPIKQPQRFEGLRQWLNREIYDTGADHHLLLRWLFNIGGLFWLLLLHMLYALYSRDWGTAAVMLLAVMLWGTYLLGPIIQGRYAYPFLCILPLFLLRPAADRDMKMDG